MALNELVQLAGIGILEEVEVNGQAPGRRFFQNVDAFNDISDNAFIKTYRLSKEMVSDLIDLLSPYMVAPSRLSDLTIETKVLTALRFFASGSYQSDIGSNLNHAISQSSVSRSIEEVSSVLNEPQIFNRFIRMPRNNEEVQRIRTQFYLNHNFPGVVGCIDCTHVAIYPPQINHVMYPEVLYVNRKSYHSINVQLICDSDLKILNVNARYPGSTHDSFIWNNSMVLQYMQNLHRNGMHLYLLGDSGYAVRPWMLTPILNPPPNSPESRYNERQMSTRSLIERCNGVLKLRFRCLLKHRVLHYGPEKCSKIINGCIVLHNICIESNLPPVEQAEEDIDVDFGIYAHEGDFEEPVVGGNRVNPDLAAGRLLRSRVIRNYFGRP